jgi:PPK2 family polyphosphate:nucleotide phosphotransferase
LKPVTVEDQVKWDVSPYRVTPEAHVDLSAIDPDAELAPGKKTVKAAQRELIQRLDQLQYLLYAEHRRRLLVVLQAPDTGGKDSTIRRVFGPLNPQGVKVTSFKVPTPVELAHDYLWRVHRRVPAAGEIGIFNRSHYEDVLVVRVHRLVPENTWRARYQQIVEFERYLAQTETVIRKFYLHISRDEQKKRLGARLDDPRKRWKMSRADLAERRYWDQYAAAYEEALSRTSTSWAPWYVVPANRKWVRDYIVTAVLVAALDELGLQLPRAPELRNVRLE